MTREEPALGFQGREYVERFLEQLSDPIHKRLIGAYDDEDPAASMESELGRVLREVVENED